MLGFSSDGEMGFWNRQEEMDKSEEIPPYCNRHRAHCSVSREKSNLKESATADYCIFIDEQSSYMKSTRSQSYTGYCRLCSISLNLSFPCYHGDGGVVNADKCCMHIVLSHS